MSHTDRHRPFWVQAADHGTDADHRHELFGQPLVHRRKKRDSRGRVVKAMQPVQIRIKDALVLHPSILTTRPEAARIRAIRDEARRRYDAGESHWGWIDGPDTASQPVMEDYVYGHYADYCSLTAERDRNGQLTGHPGLYAPCSPDLDWRDAAPSYGRSELEKRGGVHRDWRRPTRRKVRNATRAITKSADTWEDITDAESGMYTR